MCHCQIDPQNDSQNSKISTQKQKYIFQKPECCSKLFLRDHHRSQCSQCNDHDNDRTDQICTDCRLTNDQTSHDSDRIPQCPGDPHSRLPDQFKREFQKDQFDHTGKRYSLPCFCKRQDQICRKYLCVKADHRKVKPREQCRHKQCKITKCPQKRCHFKMMKPVLATLHKAIKGTWKNQCGRRIVTEHHDLSIQDLHRRPVGTFRCLILWKR